MADELNPEVHPLDLPDDELDAAFAAMEAAEAEVGAIPAEDVPTETADAVPAVEAIPDADPVDPDEVPEVTPEKDDDVVPEVASDTDPDAVPAVDPDVEVVDPEAAEAEPEAAEEGVEPEKDAINYETEYNKVLAPFKANGREVKVNSIDEAVQLMQMGANYNKKMAGMKPSLKMLKMLENNELLDESKLSYLIDLSKNDPEAIRKLVKDSGINPLDMDVEADSTYQPGAHAVDDATVALDSVIADIRDTEAYATTIDVVGTKWDEDSKSAIRQDPEILRVLNSHVEAGIYAQISEGVERERMLGNLSGMSDLAAYKAVGDAIHERDGFKTQSAPVETKPKVLTKPKKSDAQDPAILAKKRAAGPTKGAPVAAAVPGKTPLDMSDEEFLKAGAEAFKI